MNKQKTTKSRLFAMLLSICMIFSMMPISIFATDENDAVTLYISNSASNDAAERTDGAIYKTFYGAAQKANDGDIIKLQEDYTDDAAYEKTIQDKKVTFDFNGHTYTSVYDVNQSYAFLAYPGAEIHFIDSSADHTGKLLIEKNSNDKFNSYGFMAGGDTSTPSGGVTIVDGNVPMGYSTGGKIYFNNITVEVPDTGTGKPVYAISTGGEGTAYIDGPFTTNGYLSTSSGSTIRVAMGMQDKITCAGATGMIALILTENLTLDDDLNTGICRLLTPVNTNITLDLNGHNITGQFGNVYVNPTSTLNIVNSGYGRSEITNTQSVQSVYGNVNNKQQWYNSAVPSIFNGGTLNISGDVYVNNQGQSAQIVAGKSSKTYPYGVFQNPGAYDNTLVTVGDGVEIFATGGAIISNDEYESSDPEKFRSSTVRINGGTFRADNDPISVPAGSLEIKNAELSGNYGIWIGTDAAYPETLYPISDVSIKTITPYSTGIAIDTSVQSSNGENEAFILKNIQLNKKSEPTPTGFFNTTAHDIKLSGKDTFINCNTMLSNTFGYPGAPVGTGKLVITGGVFKSDPTSYIPDDDGNDVKDYAVLDYSDSSVTNYYLVAPWTRVGVDNKVDLYYLDNAAGETIAKDDVTISTPEDIDGIVADPSLVKANHFTLSSSSTENTSIDGLSVSEFKNGNRLTIAKEKQVDITSAYVWYGGRNVGEIEFNVKTLPTYDVGGEISGAVEKPTAYLICDGQKYDATVSGTANPYEYIIKNVPAGEYNLVVSSKSGEDTYTTTTTVLITVVNQAIAQNVMLPSRAYNSVVTTIGDNTPNVEAGGLDTIAETIGDSTDSIFVKIELKIEENEGSEKAEDIKKAISDSDMIKGIIMDTDVLKTINDGNEEKITEIAEGEHGVKLMKVVFHLPEALQNKESYTIFRYHGTAVDEITTEPNADGEYMLVDDDKDTITAYLCKFSTYSIAYTQKSLITFNANGGEVTPASAETELSGKLSSLPVPTKSGNYNFGGWFTTADGGIKVTTDTVFTEDSTIYAHWTSAAAVDPTETYYIITTEAGEGGSFDTGKTVPVKAGESVGFTITANKGYAIDDVKTDGKSMGAISYYVFTNVDSNHIISATFKKIENNNPQADDTSDYTITTRAGKGGSFGTGKTVSVKAGESVGFTITANKGYAIDDVKVDGKSMGAASYYVFTNVDANHIISATFRTIDHTGPQTGDASNMAYWLALLFISCGVLTILRFSKRSKDVNTK